MPVNFIFWKNGITGCYNCSVFSQEDFDFEADERLQELMLDIGKRLDEIVPFEPIKKEKL